MVGKIIETPEDVAEGAAYLARCEPCFARALTLTGELPLRRRPDGFAQLFAAIVSQQVSVASARAIWTRVEDLGATSPEAMRGIDDEALRDCGLSRQKIAYGRAIAEGGVDFVALRDLPDDAVIETLVQIKGIGIWTAEIYAMLSLGRADVFAPGDLALREAAQRLFDLEIRPSEKVLRAMSEKWRPWRSVAARLMWEYYRISTKREGIT